VRRDDFIRRVEDVAGDGLARQDTDQAITATLTTLGELLGLEQSRRMAAQLPLPLQGALRQGNGSPGRFGEREFVRRVAVRRRLPPSQALEQARAVVRVVGEAIGDGEREHLRQALADDFPLLLRPPAGPAHS
jgi:uncharacterized protein (DUF2267 family)